MPVRASSRNAPHSAEGEVACTTPAAPRGVFAGEPGCCLGRKRGRVARSGVGPAAGTRLSGCPPERAPVTWRRGLTLVRAPSGPQLEPSARMAAVQHGSTATHPDAGGLAGTRVDGDLHGWTRVDVLPPDGMQEASGSSRLAPQEVPGQDVICGPSGYIPRSSDRHLTVVLGIGSWH